MVYFIGCFQAAAFLSVCGVARVAPESASDPTAYRFYNGFDKDGWVEQANNFTEADLPRLMEFLHRRGVKGYVTFNILVFENEMAEAEQYVRAMIVAGVDAAFLVVAALPANPPATPQFRYFKSMK
jgi:collagenase-like PrtC family protease